MLLFSLLSPGHASQPVVGRFDKPYHSSGFWRKVISGARQCGRAGGEEILDKPTAARRAKPALAWNVRFPLRQTRLGDQLYEQILDRIVSGALPEGEKLPSETQLCEMFGVSRPVVREALARLQADGVVVSRHGSGSFVLRRPNKDFSLLAPAGDVAAVMRCMEYRIALEGEAAFLAADRRTDSDLRRIEQALARLDGVIASGQVGSEADRQFHMAVACAAQNRLFILGLQSVEEHTISGMELARKLSLRRSLLRLQLVQQEHIRIYEAIKAMDAASARDTMRTHIDSARLRILTDSAEP